MSLETDKMELRLTIKALTRNQSRLACKMAEDTGITGEFFHDQIDFDAPRINPMDKEKYDIVTKKINVATVELDKLDNINEPERYEAKQEVYDFISLLSLEETINFLKEVGCTSTLELVEKVIENPTLIEEAVL